MKKMLLAGAAAAVMGLAGGASAFAADMTVHAYSVTITNNMADELIAPVLATSPANDDHIYAGGYYTREAEVQILTGDPAKLAAHIGKGVTVAHGTDGPPGVLLAPGKSLTFTVETDADKLRFFAMVAPTKVPDNYLTAVVTLKDAMMKDGGMAKDSMEKDTMAKDAMAKDSMVKDAMAKDSMAKDAMMDAGLTASFERFDIGHNEKTRKTTKVEGSWATVTVTAKPAGQM